MNSVYKKKQIYCNMQKTIYLYQLKNLVEYLNIIAIIGNILAVQSKYFSP